jgi:hypothetical protein
LIRHAAFPKPLPVLPLAVPVIEPALWTLLMTLLGVTPLLASRLLPAMVTAVALSTITPPADIEQRAAPADTLME